MRALLVVLELPEKLRKAVLLIGKKKLSGTTVADAEELARYERVPGFRWQSQRSSAQPSRSLCWRTRKEGRT